MKISWERFVWGMAMLTTLVGMWVRIEMRITKVEQALALQPSPVQIEARLARIEASLETMKYTED